MNTDKYKIYTDLAIESKEMVHEGKDVEIDGVAVEIEEKEGKKVKVTRVNVFNDAGSQSIGKPIGKYVTIESDFLKQNDSDIHKSISKILSNEIKGLYKPGKANKLFVVGLGNWNVTADSLGPKVVSKTIVTNHLFENNVEGIENTFGRVSAFVPGVMGLTGIETSEVVKGIIDREKPDFLIVIDSLAARNVARVNTTIQITDTGIFPGSGVGNKRKEITKETMGIPVMAIGVPTVVNAVTLANDLIDVINNSLQGGKSITDEQKYKLINQVLSEDFQALCVTPKEEDIVVRRLRNIIADSINIYSHHGISIDDVRDYNS